MVLRYSFKTAIVGLMTHKSRSALTILGIVIGVAAIMLVVSVGGSAEEVIVGELGGLGAETVVVRPGKEPKGPTDMADLLFADSLKEREFKAILRKENVPDIVDASPAVIVTSSVSYGGETFKPFIFGFSAEFMLDMLNMRLIEGRVFDARDIRSKARLAVIGRKVRKELFGERSPIGENIQIKGVKFRVIGVFEPRGQVVFFDVDELVLIPYTSAQTYLVGFDYYNEIVARASSPERVDRVVFDIEQTLRELHRISDPDKDDFYIQTQQGIIKQVQAIIGVFTLFLSMVVAISLVVGGIGVMNIMLVSVTERTREIGLRKALGATNRNILVQFLLEAVMLTLAGGIIGIIIGTTLSFTGTLVIAQMTTFSPPFSFPLGAALLGIGVSMFVGVVFGLYPAYKASQKSPLEALRYE
jgi:putative ABC transport system permease protein